MKKASIILIIILLVITTESSGQGQAVNNDLITVDVRSNYSQKKELIIQDFMDVEYIVLETKDGFFNQGFVQDVGKKIILVINKINDGNIFVYDRSGKALRKINHKGQQTSQEYTSILGITLDEDNNEMFVNDPYTRSILVYDLYGKFKRSFKHKKSDDKPYYTDIFNYDKDNLICYYKDLKESKAFVLISKKDGSITNEVKIPFKENISLTLKSTDGTKNTKVGSTHQVTTQVTLVGPGYYRTIIPFKGNWMLLETSSDTVYTFLPDYNLRPLLVRTPSIQSMSPKVFFLLSFCSDRYYFMETMKYEYDWNTRTGFPRTSFVYDRQEKAFFECTLYNGDYSIKREIYLNFLKPVNHEIESWQAIEAYQLVESYKKGELKNGKLKDIAAKLDEEDNPVIMLVKHKK